MFSHSKPLVNTDNQGDIIYFMVDLGKENWRILFFGTVDSRYLEIEGTIINTSRYPYFDISEC